MGKLQEGKEEDQDNLVIGNEAPGGGVASPHLPEPESETNKTLEPRRGRKTPLFEDREGYQERRRRGE